MAEQIGLQGVLDLGQFTPLLNQYLSGVKQMTDQTVQSSDSITRASGGLNMFREIAVGALRQVGVVAMEAMTQAAAAVSGFVSESFAGALEDERILTRLTQAIKSTGGVAGVSASDALALADQFHSLAGGSGDLVNAIISVGLQMGTVTKDEMPAFIQAALDMGAVMGSATEAARLLAFAQEQPTASLRRFRQANVIFTDSERASIKAMEDAGDTAGAFAIIMDKVARTTGGAAQTNLDTLSGKWGLFTTTVSEAGETILGAFLPAAHALFDATLAPAIPIIDSLSSSFSSMITQVISGEATAGFEQFRNSVQQSLGDTAADAVTWGRNIVVSLANGIIDGLGAVLDALALVGNLIASWLMPGSPPKLLPDLDKWGSEAMSIYMRGWAQGDFSAFNDISSTIGNFLKSLPVGAGGQGDIITAILGSREAVAQAVTEVQALGAATQSTLQRIFDAVGVASPALQQYVATMLLLQAANVKVAKSQAELDKVTKLYDDQLAGLNARLSAIQEKQVFADEEKQIKRLTRIANDQRGSVARRSAAQAALDELLLKRKIRQTEQEKKVAVGAAQVKLDAAKEEQTRLMALAQAQKAMVDAMTEQNRLVGERIRLDEQAAKVAEAAAKAAAAAKAGGGKGLPKFAAPKLPGGGLADILSPAKLAGTLAAAWDKFIAPLKGKFEAVRKAWEPVFAAIAKVWNNTIMPAFAALSQWVSDHRAEIMAFLAGVMAALAGFSILSSIVGWVGGVVVALGGLYTAFTVAGGGIAGLVAILGGPVTVAIAAIAIAMGLLAAAWTGNWFGMRDALTAFWTDTAQPALSELWTWLSTNLPPAIQALAAFWTGTLQPAIAQVWAWVTGTLFPALSILWMWLGTTLTTSLQKLSDFWRVTLLPAMQAVWAWMQDPLFPFLESVANLLSAVLGVAIQEVTDLWNDALLPALQEVYKWFNENIAPVIRTVTDRLGKELQPVLESVSKFISEVFLVALSAISTSFDGITAALKAATEWFNKVADAIRGLPSTPTSLTGHSPSPFEAGLAGIRKQMRALVAEMPEFGMEMSALRRQPSPTWAGVGANYSNATNHYWNYSPTYRQPPANEPSESFAQLMAGALYRP